MDKRGARIRRARMPLPISGILDRVIPKDQLSKQQNDWLINARQHDDAGRRVAVAHSPCPPTVQEFPLPPVNLRPHTAPGRDGGRACAINRHQRHHVKDGDVLMIAPAQRPASATTTDGGRRGTELRYTPSVRRFRNSLGRALQMNSPSLNSAPSAQPIDQALPLEKGHFSAAAERQRQRKAAGELERRHGKGTVGESVSSRTLLAQADESDWERIPFSFFVDGYVGDSLDSMGGGGNTSGSSGSGDGDGGSDGGDGSWYFDARTMGSGMRAPPRRYYMHGRLAAEDADAAAAAAGRHKCKERSEQKRKKAKHRKHNWNTVWTEVTGQRYNNEKKKKKKKKKKANGRRRRTKGDDEAEALKAKKMKAGRAWLKRMKQTIAKRLRARGIALRSPQRIKQGGGAKSAQGRMSVTSRHSDGGAGGGGNRQRRRRNKGPVMEVPTKAGASDETAARLRPLESILTPGLPSSGSMLTPEPAAPSHNRAGSGKGFRVGSGIKGVRIVMKEDSFTSASGDETADDGDEQHREAVVFPVIDGTKGGDGDQTMAKAPSPSLISGAATAGGSYRSTSTWALSIGSAASLKDVAVQMCGGGAAPMSTAGSWRSCGSAYRRHASEGSLLSTRLSNFCVSVASSNSRN